MPVGYDLDLGTEALPAEIVLTRVVAFENEDGEPDEMTQYILPDHDDDDSLFPSSIEREGGSNWNFSFDLNDPDDDAFEAIGDEKFEIRILKGNSLRKEVEQFVAQYKREHPAPDPKDINFIDEVITKLKNHDPVRKYIQASYEINLYNPDVLNFVKLDDNHRIDPSLKTLILIPGTFKKSLENTLFIDGTQDWEGSKKKALERI